MTPETVDLLRHLARRRGDVGTMARAALALEGERAADGIEPADGSGDEVEARRQWERDRKARQRAGKRVVPGDVPSCPTVVPPPVPGAVPGDNASLSLSSSSESLEKESESSSLGTRESGTCPVVPRVVPPPVPGAVPGTGTRYAVQSNAPADILITEEIRASCLIAGAAEPTPADVVACLANARKKGFVRADWASELVSWQCKGKAFALRKSGVEAEPPGAVEHRRRQQDEAQRRRDDEDRRYAANAVPAPIGDLLAALGPPKRAGVA